MSGICLSKRRALVGSGRLDVGSLYCRERVVTGVAADLLAPGSCPCRRDLNDNILGQIKGHNMHQPKTVLWRNYLRNGLRSGWIKLITIGPCNVLAAHGCLLQLLVSSISGYRHGGHSSLLAAVPPPCLTCRTSRPVVRVAGPHEASACTPGATSHGGSSWPPPSAG